MKRLVVDIEADCLYDNVTTVWCIVTKDIDTGITTAIEIPTKRSIESHLAGVDLLIGHNIIDYDLPVLQKIFGYTYKGEVFDTYTASCLFNPDRRGGHSLNAWGKRLGFEKYEFNDFSKLTPEMVKYCMRDVGVTLKVYEALSHELGLE